MRKSKQSSNDFSVGKLEPIRLWLKANYLLWGPLLVWLLFWWPVISGQEQFYIRDLTFYALPMKTYMMERLQAGEFPFWTPRLSTGMPFFAEPSHQVLYPFNLLFFMTPTIAHGISWFVLAHYLLSMWAMVFLARVLGLSKPLALFTALIYGLSGYVISIGDNVNYQPAIVWAPLALATYLRGFQENALPVALRYSALTALCLSLMLLAGDSLNPLCMGIFATLMLGWRLYQTDWMPGLSFWRGVLHWTVSFALVALLCAVQILPTLELTLLSVRQEPLHYDEITLWSFPLERLIEFVVPFFYGSKLPHPHFIGQFMYPQFREPWADSIYLGLISVVLALIALTFDAKNRVWGLVVLIAFLLGFGSNAFYYPLLLKVFPLLTTQRYLEKFIFWAVLGGSVLTGLGAAALPVFWERLSAWLSRWGVIYKTALFAVLHLLSGILFVWIPAQLWIWPHNYERSNDWGAHFYERAPHVAGLFAHWFVIAAVVLAIFWVRRDWLRRYIQVLLVIAVLDLAWTHYAHGGTVHTDLLAYRPEPVAKQALRSLSPPPNVRIYYDDATEVKEHPSESRILDRIAASYHLPYLTDNFYYYWAYRILYNQERLLFNYGIAYDVNYLNGRFAPLQLKNHKRLDVVLTQHDINALLELANVSYVITPVFPMNPDWEKPGFTEVFRDPGFNLRLIRVDHTLPRAYVSPNGVENPEPMTVFKWIAHDFKQLVDKQHAVELSWGPPLKTVLPPDTPGLFPAPSMLSVSGQIGAMGQQAVGQEHAPAEQDVPLIDVKQLLPLKPADARLLQDRPEAIDVSVRSPYQQTAWLVLTESWFPGWEAMLESRQSSAQVAASSQIQPARQRLPIYLANQRFMAVPIPPGEHQVSFRYHSTWFTLGLWLSFFGMLLTAALCAWPTLVKMNMSGKCDAS